jgi:hypothetical protein
MLNINQLQNSSAIAQLLGIQSSTQTSTVQPAQPTSSQTFGADSLSISNAAMQALQGLGLDPSSQTQPDQASATYTAHGHHHHHHQGGAQAQSVASAQVGGTTSQSTQLPQASQTAGGTLQANS